MLKSLTILIFLSLLVGCTIETRSNDITSEYVLPPGFEDCKVYRVISKTQNNLTLISCEDNPMNSINIRVREGKVEKEYIIIDGIRYKKDSGSAKKIVYKRICM